jgi:hypothetical protein
MNWTHAKAVAKHNKAQWYMSRRYMYIFPGGHHSIYISNLLFMLPVWIEVQYRDLIFEPQRKRLVEQLGLILHYTHGDSWKSYPHDTICILWGLRRTIP